MAMSGARWRSMTASRAQLERRGKGGDGDRRAGARRRHRAFGLRRPCQRDHPHAPCCRPRSTPSSSSTRPAAIIEFNPAAEKMFGLQRSRHASARTCSTRSSRNTTARATPMAREYMAGRGAPMVGQRMETVTQNAAGEVFPIELTATEMKVADRRLFFGSIRDLRERAAGRGGDQPPARETAPEREDGGDGLAARRRLARTQQPAGGGGGTVDAAARICRRSADQVARRKSPRRRRTLRPHRQELPRHGSPASDQPGRDRPQPGGPLGARSHRLWRALQRHRHRHRFRRRPAAASWPMPTTSPRSPPTSWSTASTRWPRIDGDRRIKVRTFRTERRQSPASRSRTMARACPRRSATASSNPISPPSRSASAPASACRSRNRSSSATMARIWFEEVAAERRALRRRAAGHRPGRRQRDGGRSHGASGPAPCADHRRRA